MESLILNGFEVDLPDNSVSLNLQVNDLGELKDRQSDYTNRFKLDLTPKNISVMENLGIIGNQSTVPYRNISAKWTVEGVELIPDGFATVSSVIENDQLQNYEVNIYSNNIDFFNAIDGKSIRDIDFSDINHRLDFVTMVESFDGSKDYIYAIVGYTGKIPVQDNFNLKYMLPSIFLSALWERIWSEAGFTYTGDVFTDPDFLEIIVGATSFDPGQTDLLQKDFKTILPDIDQKQIVKEVLWRYGLMFQKLRNENEYQFKYIKDVLKDKATSVNYSSNLKSISKTSFRLGSYAKKNFFRYADSNDGTQNQDGSIDIDIENLDTEKELMTSVFEANPTLTPFKYFEKPVFEIDLDNDDLKITEQKAWIAKLNYLSDSTNFIDENEDFQVFGGDKPFAQFFDLSFRRQVYFNYREIGAVIEKAQVFDIGLMLTPIEVYQFDFLKLMYFEQLGAYFYCNRLKNYRSDKVTSAEVVRIPETVFEIIDDAVSPVVDLQVDANTISHGAISTFTLLVTEENIDTWVLDFGYASQQVSGIGQPPSTVTHQFPVGTYTAILTVTDFEGNQGSDSEIITISAIDDVQIDPVNGEITAPPGATMTFKLSIAGSGTLSGFAGVAETFGGANTLASGQVDNDTVDLNWSSTYETTFIMPGSGLAYLTGSCSPIGGGSTGGALIIQIKLLTETETVIVNLSTTYP